MDVNLRVAVVSSGRSSLSLRREAGFTLVELLIVVAILGILASLAGVGFRRYVARARVTEAVTLLSEMSSKEQIYFLEFGAYLPLRRDGITMPSSDENTAAFYPSDPSASTFESARTATSIANPAAWPTAWRSVGLRVRDQQLYCTYLVNAGGPGAAAPAGAAYAGSLLGTLNANSPAWFYAVAACNLTGVSGYPNNVTVLGLSSNRSTLATFNDGQ
jgi:prepilin-type N-terminal cleavage/methylation domain-containing protein